MLAKGAAPPRAAPLRYFVWFALKGQFQSKLHQAWISSAFNTAKIRPVGDTAVRIQKLSMVKDVKKLAAKFHVHSFAQRRDFLHGKIEVGNAWSATDGSRGVAQELQRS